MSNGFKNWVAPILVIQNPFPEAYPSFVTNDFPLVVYHPTLPVKE